MKIDMTEEQIRQNTQEKVEKVKALCKELHLTIGAKQRMGMDMFLENIVVFTDTENYPTPVIERGPEAPIDTNATEDPILSVEEKENAESTNL